MYMLNIGSKMFTLAIFANWLIYQKRQVAVLKSLPQLNYVRNEGGP